MSERRTMLKSRKQKVKYLRRFIDPESGEVFEQRFKQENRLYQKAAQKKALDRRIVRCNKCPGLNVQGDTEACPGWGNLNARIFFIGQSLHQPGVLTGLPFISGSGFLIDAALRLSGLDRYDVFFSNVIHCHPPQNRASTAAEKANCLPYLQTELSIVRPRLVVAMGVDAKRAVAELMMPKSVRRVLKMEHPASFYRSGASDSRKDWAVRLSTEMDKII